MKRIIICTDGSQYSDACCRYATWIAKRMASSLETVYVSDLWQYETPLIADLGASFGMQPFQGFITQMQEMEKEKSALLETALHRIFKEAGWDVPVLFHHRTGFLQDVLDALESEGNPVDLVVLGKRGENANVATGHLGSTMERVVRASNKPCLVASRAYHPIQRVVFAYDGGASCQAGLDWIVQNVAILEHCQLQLVSVLDDAIAAADALRDAETRLTQGGLKPQSQLLHGIPQDAISSFVEMERADLLMMGAYGHGRLREFFIGSTTAELLMRCQVPVLMFR